ncbi:hypothetical protein FACS1894199_18470 [Bacteroidia bacterium]|nr:hypothetical protein FACS1894199_18470 [Bacteroidia bacterium]
MPYKIAILNAAKKGMRKLPREYYNSVSNHIYSLANNPRPFGCKKMSDSEDKYRIRVGVYRIIYTIKDDILTVEVVKVDHRSSVYK